LRQLSAITGTLSAMRRNHCPRWTGICSASAHAQQVGDLIHGQATKLVDADTFDIGPDCGLRGLARRAIGGGDCWRICIWGIDAADKWERCLVAGQVFKLAKPSKQALKECLRGSTMTCRVQKIQRGRLKLRYVSECYRDDSKEDVAACMVTSGWATDWPGYSGGYYAPLEEEPKAGGRGLWQCDDGPPTKRWCRGGEGIPCEQPIYKPRGP
jgi:endonuclease YncB( thermonuclease family)